ncbi:urease accessory protein UreE [Aliiruegeria sabulilitoris]|uniref:urease accessory protein UreE n=1 Tax=Aliiruegeria sabulilitoris TaxID=1510458 RepID=UPI0008333C22|nr:urease accessory protein UreE [Aliiruegeria sabulilitoris]NDR55266.1 urease accessory protein UreE [Pseudoruegeria sp. M32A2M]
MSKPERAFEIRRGAGRQATDHVRLDYEARFLRRKRLETATGRVVLVDLPETVSFEDGDALVLEGGGLVGVFAEDEPLLAISGPDLARLAWHIGNRHTPCRIEEDRLLIRDDHVLAAMLKGLGAQVRHVTEPFSPEGGAYGHGRTLGHSHGDDGHHHHEH